MKSTVSVLDLTSLCCGILFAIFPVEQVLAQSQPGASRTFNSEEGGWNKEAAARYLDDRMDLWFQKAKKLGTGEGKTSCISCHTVVPYALARPLLRKAAGVSKPTGQELRLLEETVRRVDTYDTHEPLYKSKEKQSRGTEAVLNLLILAGEDSRQDFQLPGEPTRKALDELWKEQRPDGAWDWLDFGNEPYESSDSVFYGATLAAIGIGSVPGNLKIAGENVSGHIASLRSYLNGNYAGQNFYNKTWMLLASTRMKGLLATSQRESLITELERHQNADGGWSLHSLGPWTWSRTNAPFAPEGKPDVSLLSNSDGFATGLIAYTLSQAGLAAGHPALKRSTAWLKANQREYQIEQNHWQCWRTYSLNYDREHGGDEGEPWRRMFMSDAATAFASLALLSNQ
jgi:hypothetical protein